MKLFSSPGSCITFINGIIITMKYPVFAIIGLFFTSVCFGQGFWHQTAGPESGTIVAFGTGAQGRILAASDSSIYYTNDFGKQWTKASGQFSLSNDNIFVRDSGGALYLCDNENIYRSTDNGENWTSIATSISAQAEKFTGVAVNSRDFLFAATAGNTVFRSTDYGANWAQVPTGFPSDQAIGGFYDATEIAAAPNGDVYVATTGGGLTKTTNDGANWTSIGNGNVYATSLAISGSGKIFIATLQGLSVSADDGKTWKLVQGNGLPPGLIQTIATDGKSYVAISSGTKVWTSADDGVTWKESLQSFANEVDQALYCDNGGAHILSGKKTNGIYYSSDGGLHFVPESFGIITARSLAVAQDGKGNIFGLGKNGIYTLSPNDTWDSLTTGLDFRTLGSASNNDLYAMAYGKYLYYSSDHGVTWKENFSIPTQQLTKISLFTSTASGHLFVAGEKGVIYHADLKGSFIIRRSGVIQSDITMLGADDHGYIYAGNADGMFHQYDTSKVWDTLVNAPKGAIAFAADSSGNIYAATVSAIHTSPDKGKTWSQVTGFWSATAMAVTDKGILIAAGNTGTFYSTNQGKDWTLLDHSLDNLSPTSIIFSSKNNTLYAGTAANGVYAATPPVAGGGGNSVHSASKPVSFSFEENYPNPFFTSTTIRYKLTEPGNVRLNIFNSLGMEISELASEFQSAGIHEVLLDAGKIRIPGGVYYCRLEVNGASITRPVIYLGK